MTTPTGAKTIKTHPEKAHRINRKIGSTTYAVSINFSKTGRENINEKILRLIRNEAQANA